jgi:hypothetical protein
VTLVGIAIVLFVSSSMLLAKPGVVKTKSGHTYYGEVTRDPDGTVIVTIRGVETRVPGADVDLVTDQAGDFKQDFENRRRLLDPKDPAGFIELAHFALDNREFLMANEAVEQALKADPTNKDAMALRDTIRQEARADRQRSLGGGRPKASTTQSTTPPSTPPGHEPPTAPPENPMPPAQPENPPAENGGAAAPPEEKPAPPLAPGERRLVNAEDIQKIRRIELKRGDTARIQIPQDVRRNFVNRNGLNFSQFNAKPAVEQALEIFEKGDDEMRDKVRILTDPESLTQFKGLQRNIVQGCATNACHGPQASAAGFVLYPPDSDPATYTNFYVLMRTTKRVGASTSGPFGGPSERAMIERGTGAQSLLAQYALPPSKSEHPHPKAGNYRGIYSGQEDARYKKLIDWMNNVLKPVPPDPDYQIDYPIPGKTGHRGAATKPATGATRGG